MRRLFRFILAHPITFSLIFILFFCISCFVFIWIVLKPSMSHGFDLSNQQNIGQAIGGLTAPVVGIASALLLFMTLIYQIQNISRQEVFSQNQHAFSLNQQQKDEFDIVLSLFSLFMEELNTFHYTYNTIALPGKSERIVTSGLEGLNKFVLDFEHEHVKLLVGYEKGTPGQAYVLEHFFQSNSISLLIDSMRTIQKKIDGALLPDGYKEMLQEKHDSYHSNFLAKQLFSLLDAINAYPKTSLWMHIKIKNYLDENKKAGLISPEDL